MKSFTRQTYKDRVQNMQNDAAKRLLEIMELKKSNLCVSVDVTKKVEFLEIIKAVAPHTALIKTHIDILEDFDHELIGELKQLSEEHNFMIFEDRKFADIGNTVKLQYESGVHKIASWSDITNAHTVPGPSVVIGLKEVGLRQERKRGLLLLAEMSTKGSLAVDSYTKASVQMAMEHRDFVIGFIAQQRMIDASEGCDFLVLTPGVALGLRGDGMGQQYRTPEEVIAAGCDVIIVGRGIYETDRKLDVAGAGEKARQYQEAGWEAYSKSIGTQAEVSL